MTPSSSRRQRPRVLARVPVSSGSLLLQLLLLLQLILGIPPVTGAAFEWRCGCGWRWGPLLFLGTTTLTMPSSVHGLAGVVRPSSPPFRTTTTSTTTMGRSTTSTTTTTITTMSMARSVSFPWRNRLRLQPPTTQPSQLKLHSQSQSHTTPWWSTPIGTTTIMAATSIQQSLQQQQQQSTRTATATTTTTTRLYSTLDPAGHSDDGIGSTYNDNTTNSHTHNTHNNTETTNQEEPDKQSILQPQQLQQQQLQPQQQQSSSSSRIRNDDTNVDGIPSYKTMLLFIGTTILIWLSEPLLSLVDTTVVGQYATTNVLQLAALGPATMLMDSAIYMTYFLAIATTNTVANGLAKKREYRKLQTSTSQVLGFATVLGTMITALVFGAGRPLLHRAAGGSSSPALLQLALTYCQIRSLVAPLAILGMVAQSVCLACLDTTTPAIAVAVASLVNVVGDMALVPHLGMQGAAIATAVASASAALILLRQVRHIMRGWRIQEQLEETNNNNKDSSSNKDATTTTIMNTIDPISTVLNGIPRLEYGTQSNDTNTPTIPPTSSVSTSVSTSTAATAAIPVIQTTAPSVVPFWSLPGPTALVSLLLLTGPIFFCLVGKIICYSALSLRAADFGVTALAAHNVMIRIFFFGATFGDPLSQASQTFVPRLLMSSSTKKTKTSANANANTKTTNRHSMSTTSTIMKSKRKLIRRMAIIAAAFGIGTKWMAQLVLTRFGSYFTTDASILALLGQASSWAGWALLLHPFIMLLEGCILASQDVFFLLASYGVTMACHFASLQLNATSFVGVWRALFFFQTFRLAQFTWRVWDQSLREQRIPSTSSSSSATTVMTTTDGVGGGGISSTTTGGGGMTTSVIVPAN